MAVLAPSQDQSSDLPVSEQRLWQQFAATRDARAREELVRRYMPFARRLALRYHYAAEPFDDLVQVANLGLLNAIDRFDPSRENGFVAFATPTILGELKRHFRDRAWTIRLPRGIHDLRVRIEKVADRLTAELERSPSAAEIAERLEVDVLDVLEALEAAQKRSPLSLDHPLDESEESEQSGEWFGSEDPAFEYVENRIATRGALPGLDERQREVVRLRFVEELSQAEIAKRIGYSQMHVSRILRGALQQLREDAGDRVGVAEPG